MMSDKIMDSMAAPIAGPKTFDTVSIDRIFHIPSRGEDQYSRNEHWWHCIRTEILRELEAQRSTIKMSNCECAQTQQEPKPHLQLRK